MEASRGASANSDGESSFPSVVLVLTFRITRVHGGLAVHFMVLNLGTLGMLNILLIIVEIIKHFSSLFA